MPRPRPAPPLPRLTRLRTARPPSLGATLFFFPLFPSHFSFSIFVGQVPYFTVSGIQVRYLKIIEKSGYQALPWVRYITQNGDYQLRMS